MKRFHFQSFVPAALLVLAGCASMAPEYRRPALPVPDAFPVASVASAAASASAPTASPASAAASAGTLPWTQFVPDERARRLVQAALEGNRDLRVAVLSVEQARALLGVQRADQLPSVGVGANVTRGTTVTGSTGGTYTAGFTLSAFEVDLFGRVRSLTDAAAARYLASDEGRRAAQLSLVATVVQADLALRADDELLALTRQVLTSRESTLSLVQRRFDVGASAEPELRANESLVAAARVTAAALERQKQLDANALVLLLGQPLPAALPAPVPLAETRFAELPAGLPSDVLLARPDVRQAEQQLIAANANIGAARAAFFPRISLTASLGVASAQLSNLFDGSGAWSVAGQLLQPLFDAGRNRNNLAATEAQRDIAVAQYEKAVQAAFREVADALAGRGTLAQQLDAQRAQATAETRRLALIERLLQGGAASSLDRLDAERSALAARQAVVQLQLAQAQNAVQLYRALGGGAAAVSP
jgi:NodT family efflux transporter outer membrane factor (OMF) lipoprotein